MQVQIETTELTRQVLLGIPVPRAVISGWPLKVHRVTLALHRKQALDPSSCQHGHDAALPGDARRHEHWAPGDTKSHSRTICSRFLAR